MTALVFAMSFPEHRVVIVTPEEIQFTWRGGDKEDEAETAIRVAHVQQSDESEGKTCLELS